MVFAYYMEARILYIYHDSKALFLKGYDRDQKAINYLNLFWDQKTIE